MTDLIFEAHLPVVQRTGWALFHSTWQIALIAVAFAAVNRLLARSSPNARYLAGLAALAMTTVGPLATVVFLAQPAAVSSAHRARTIDSVASPAARGAKPAVRQGLSDSEHSARRLTAGAGPARGGDRFGWHERIASRIEPCLPWSVAFWLAGMLLFSARPTVGLLHAGRLRRRGRSAVPDSIRKLAGELSHCMGIRRPVEIACSSLARVPGVIGVFRPLILLPASALTGLSPDQLRAMLAHELSHVRRHDYLVNLLQTGLETVFFYHPAVWWMSHRVREEREHCCDDLALAHAGDRLAYAGALIALAEARRSAAAPLLAGTGGPLVQRIRRIARRETPAGRTPTAWVALVIPFVAVACVCAAVRGQATRPAEAPIDSAASEEDGTMMAALKPQEGRAADPDLLLARKYDSELNGGVRLEGGQDKAEQHYLAALSRVGDPATRSAIYTQLGVLFTTNFHRELGERPDYAKARRYFAKALEAEPKRIGKATIRARLHRVTPDMSRSEMFEQRLDNYKWLTSWDEESIRQDWIPLDYQVNREDRYFPSFLRFLENVIKSETTNLIALADTARDPLAWHSRLADEVPDTAAGVEAAARLEAIEEGKTEVVPDGVYRFEWPEENAVGVRVRRHDADGTILLGRRLTDDFGRATVTSVSNDNSQFRIELASAGPIPQEPWGNMALMAGGICACVWSHSDRDAEGRVDLAASLVGEENAARVAGRLGIRPVLRRHPGHKMRVAFSPDKPSYRVGDEITLAMSIENVGDKAFSFLDGGRQRGHRNNQFSFTARGNRGAGPEIPDAGDPTHHGGKAVRVTIGPGQSFTKNVTLDDWFQFAEPDVYRVSGRYAMEILEDEGADQRMAWDDVAQGECLVTVTSADSDARRTDPSPFPQYRAEAIVLVLRASAVPARPRSGDERTFMASEVAAVRAAAAALTETAGVPLTVKTVSGTNLISIAVSGTEPRAAASMCSQITERYLASPPEGVRRTLVRKPSTSPKSTP